MTKQELEDLIKQLTREAADLYAYADMTGILEENARAQGIEWAVRRLKEYQDRTLPSKIYIRRLHNNRYRLLVEVAGRRKLLCKFPKQLLKGKLVECKKTGWRAELLAKNLRLYGPTGSRYICPGLGVKNSIKYLSAKEGPMPLVIFPVGKVTE